MEFQAIAFDAQISGQSKGNLKITSSGLQFFDGSLHLELARHNLQVALSGQDDWVLLTNPHQPNRSFSVRDQAILEDLQRIFPELGSQIEELQKDQKSRSRSWLVAGVVMCLLIASCFPIKNWLVRKTVNAIPTEWEIQLGESSWQSLSQQYLLIEDPEIVQDVMEICSPLLDSVQSEYPFKLHVVEDPTLNAFALPGGHMVLHTGLILAADRPEEILGVLAHEMAHVTQRHSIRAIVKMASNAILISIIAGDLEGISGFLVENSHYLVQKKFSRKQEFQADSVGFDYLVSAGIDPSGLITFFEKVGQEMEEDELNKQFDSNLNFLSTHPSSEDRMKKLKMRLEKEKLYVSTLPFDLHGLQETIKRKTNHQP